MLKDITFIVYMYFNFVFSDIYIYCTKNLQTFSLKTATFKFTCAIQKPKKLEEMVKMARNYYLIFLYTSGMFIL